jgi:hypothetical protein
MKMSSPQWSLLIMSLYFCKTDPKCKIEGIDGFVTVAVAFIQEQILISGDSSVIEQRDWSNQYVDLEITVLKLQSQTILALV